MSAAVSGEPRPYGRQPVALRELSESIALQLERELRAVGAVDSAALFVKAYWLRAGDDRYGWPDYARAYVWVAPVLMNRKRARKSSRSWPRFAAWYRPAAAATRAIGATLDGRSCSPSSTCKPAEVRHDRPAADAVRVHQAGPASQRRLSVQEIDIASGSPPVARRPEGTSRFDLTFEGTRNANVRDRHTRVRISLPITLAAQLWRQLDAQLEDSEKAARADA